MVLCDDTGLAQHVFLGRRHDSVRDKWEGGREVRVLSEDFTATWFGPDACMVVCRASLPGIFAGTRKPRDDGRTCRRSIMKSMKTKELPQWAGRRWCETSEWNSTSPGRWTTRNALRERENHKIFLASGKVRTHGLPLDEALRSRSGNQPLKRACQGYVSALLIGLGFQSRDPAGLVEAPRRATRSGESKC